jgi:hypothetical protein
VVALTFAHYCYRFIGAVKLQNKIDLQTQISAFFEILAQKKFFSLMAGLNVVPFVVGFDP